MARINWTWNPTSSQREVFEEWKKFAIGYLVSSREGVNIRSVPNYLEENVGEDIPLEKMGFRTINQFLYEMNDSIEVRTLYGRLFVFIREMAVPPNMQNIRQLVLGQAKDKGCKGKNGLIKRPTKAQSSYCRPEELLVPVQHIISRPGPVRPMLTPAAGTSGGITQVRRVGAPGNFSRPSNYSGRPQGQVSGRSFQSNSNTRNPGQIRRTPLTSGTSRPLMSSGTGRPPISSGTSSSTFKPYTFPKPAVAIPQTQTRSAFFNDKENNPNPTASMEQDDWDDWSTSKTSTIKPSTAASSYNPNPGRPIRIPDGLILSEEDLSDSDDGFDYYTGPSRSTKKDTYDNITVNISSADIAAIKKPATSQASNKQEERQVGAVSGGFRVTIPNPSAETAVIKKPVISQQTLPSSTMTERISTASKFVPTRSQSSSSVNTWKSTSDNSTTSTVGNRTTAPLKPLENTRKPATIIGASILSPSVSVAITKPIETKPALPVSKPALPVSKPVTPSISSTSNSIPTRSAGNPTQTQQTGESNKISTVQTDTSSQSKSSRSGITLETDNVFAQVLPAPLTKEPAVRLTFQLPKIKFPPLFRGGSVRANLSLKAYLSAVSNVGL